MNTNLIYALYDPRNDMPVYVGKTTIGVNRPIKHLHYSHSSVVREWVSELNKIGCSPIIKIIEKDIELNQLSDREKYWIKEYYDINPELLNQQLMSGIKDDIQYKIDKEELVLVENYLNNIPMLLKSLKYLTNKNQVEIADTLNISYGTIKRIENGKNISVDVLINLINGAIRIMNEND